MPTRKALSFDGQIEDQFDRPGITAAQALAVRS